LSERRRTLPSRFVGGGYNRHELFRSRIAVPFKHRPPTHWPCGVRCRGRSHSGFRANLRTCPTMASEKAQPASDNQQRGAPSGLARVHVMTGPGTLPRNPKNRLEYLRYAQTGETPLSAGELIERIPELQQFARLSAESGPALPYDQPEQLKALSLK